MQVHEQLLVELELSHVAAAWRTTALQRRALHTWHTAAAAAAQQRVQEAAHQRTWSRVQGWLTEMEDSSRAADVAAGGQEVGSLEASSQIAGTHEDTTAGAAGPPASSDTAAAAAAAACVSGPDLVQSGAIEVDMSLWDVDLPASDHDDDGNEDNGYDDDGWGVCGSSHSCEDQEVLRTNNNKEQCAELTGSGLVAVGASTERAFAEWCEAAAVDALSECSHC